MNVHSPSTAAKLIGDSAMTRPLECHRETGACMRMPIISMSHDQDMIRYNCNDMQLYAAAYDCSCQGSWWNSFCGMQSPKIMHIMQSAKIITNKHIPSKHQPTTRSDSKANTAQDAGWKDPSLMTSSAGVVCRARLEPI